MCRKKKHPRGQELASPASTCNRNCPDGWIDPALNITRKPYCYKFVEESRLLIWDMAHLNCKLMKADLLSFDNKKEGEWIKSQIQKERRYYLNMHRDLYGIEWKMSNSVSPSEVGLVWPSTEPNDRWNLEDCAEFGKSGEQLYINDYFCSESSTDNILYLQDEKISRIRARFGTKSERC